MIALYRSFEHLSEDLLRLFACALELPESWFADKIDRHFSIMSTHHYPPLTEQPRPGQLRTGAHTDFGAMTILAMTDAAGGLKDRCRMVVGPAWWQGRENSSSTWGT